MATLRDNPRPSGFWPGTPTQWREPTVDDCTWYAGEAAWEAASKDHLSMHPVLELRIHSSDTKGGTRPQVMMDEMKRLWPKSQEVLTTYGTQTKTELRRALLGGASLIISGDYIKLPPHYRRWTLDDDFQHSMMVKFLSTDDKTFLYDPLGGGPQREFYDGEWIPFEELFGPGKFTWANTGGYVAGIVQNKERNAVNQMYATNTSRELRVRRGTPVFSAPRAITHVKKLWQERQWRPWFGNTTNGWRLISYDLDDGRAYGYVHSSDVLEGRMLEVTSPLDCIALKAEVAALSAENQDLNEALKNYEEVIPRVRDDLATLP